MGEVPGVQAHTKIDLVWLTQPNITRNFQSGADSDFMFYLFSGIYHVDVFIPAVYTTMWFYLFITFLSGCIWSLWEFIYMLKELQCTDVDVTWCLMTLSGTRGVDLIDRFFCLTADEVPGFENTTKRILRMWEQSTRGLCLNSWVLTSQKTI